MRCGWLVVFFVSRGCFLLAEGGNRWCSRRGKQLPRSVWGMFFVIFLLCNVWASLTGIFLGGVAARPAWFTGNVSAASVMSEEQATNGDCG